MKQTNRDRGTEAGTDVRIRRSGKRRQTSGGGSRARVISVRHRCDNQTKDRCESCREQEERLITVEDRATRERDGRDQASYGARDR